MKKPMWAARLEAARIDAGYPAASQFARKIGLSQQRYQHYESGKREPDYGTLIQIANALSVSVSYILTGEGETLAERYGRQGPQAA